MSYTVEIDTNKKIFVLKGDLKKILSNKKILLTLKRLGFTTDNDMIFIPYEEKREIESLNNIKNLFQIYDISLIVLSGENNDLKRYINEIENFKEFASKAKLIRDNEFSESPELINDFEDFQRLIKINLTRTLYSLQLLSAFHMSFAQNSCNFSQTFCISF